MTQPQPSFLIVDDMESNRLYLTRLIGRYFPDAHVREAVSGDDALTAIAAEPPDIVLLDVIMPGLSGFDVCRVIKTNPATQTIFVLMISGQRTDVQSRVCGLEEGADSYLCKPFEPAELIAQIHALLRIRAVEQTMQEQQRLLEDARDEALAAARAKGEFLAHMSHEIRTPLNAVIGMTEMLMETKLDREQQEYADTIHSASETLLRIVNDILDFSKIESDRMALESRSMRLRHLVGDAIRLVQAQADAKKLSLITEFAPDVPESVLCDPLRLGQILANLLNNAVKFTARGEVRLTVSARPLDTERCEFLFAIRDTGIGIAAEKLACLFQPFSQVDASISRSYGGTGLGLVISDRLAKLMQGRIEIESKPSEGSTFRLFVCLTAEGGGLSPHKHVDADVRVENLRILVAEDNPTNRHVIGLMLDRLGPDYAFAEDGQAAVEAVRKRPYDVVLMDLQMPVLDGLAAMRQLREELPRPRHPWFIALTAHATHGAREEYLAAGMDDYLSKPVRRNELQAALARIPRRSVEVPKS